jgi:hypothetical protein
MLVATEFDDMKFEDDGAMTPDGEDEMLEDEAEEEIDAEFAMHAAALGFNTPEQQKAFKSAVERCVALKEEGAYEEDPMGDMGGDDLEGLEGLV